MERVQVLIDKLVQQKQQNESAAQLLVTVQLLQTELLQAGQQKKSFSTNKVAVVMPSVRYTTPQHTPVAIIDVEKPVSAQPVEAMQETEKQEAIPELPVPVIATVPEPVQEAIIAKEEITEAPQQIVPVIEPEPLRQETPQRDLFNNESYTLKRPAFTLQEEQKAPEIKPEPQTPPAESESEVPEYHPFDAINETPTLVQYMPPPKLEPEPKEVHQLISGEQLSLNDRLKQEKTELAHVLKDTPVKDLRKAIGINDKFLFVNELFRGDEAMYERSIKTINSFRVLQEAEYWMNRELKVKLGWNDNKEVVQHFYQLVRRRFS